MTDRDVKRRLSAALPLLLSQGRAPGVVVVAAVQDPRKEVLPFRDLFLHRVALRMSEAEQADLVLGSGARDRGARCEEVPESAPGTGFVVVEGQAEPVRVRAAWVDDSEISRISQLYRVPLSGVVLDPGPDAWTPDLFRDGEAA